MSGLSDVRRRPDVVGRANAQINAGRSARCGAEYVSAWASAWAQPTADRLADQLLHPDVRFVAPMMNTTVGLEACREELRRLRASMPDVHNEVVRWSATGELVFIELIMHGTLAGESIRIPAVDRILLRDGKAIERVGYADTVPVIAALLRHPTTWRRWWRAGAGPPSRRRRLEEPPPIARAASDGVERAVAALGALGTEDSSAAAEFVRRFAERWAEPDPDSLIELCHRDVRLEAPLMRATVGYEACREEFRRLIALRPDVHIEVHRWSARGDVVFIELTMHATVGAESVRTPAVDRILLKDGLVFERVSYADSLPVLGALLRHPAEWRRWWRSGLGPPRRRCSL